MCFEGVEVEGDPSAPRDGTFSPGAEDVICSRCCAIVSILATDWRTSPRLSLRARKDANTLRDSCSLNSRCDRSKSADGEARGVAPTARVGVEGTAAARNGGGAAATGVGADARCAMLFKCREVVGAQSPPDCATGTLVASLDCN